MIKEEEGEGSTNYPSSPKKMPKFTNTTSLHPAGMISNRTIKSRPESVNSDTESDLDSEEFEEGESYWGVLIWNLPMDYTQFVLVFELIAHVRVMIEYPKNIYNYPSITLLVLLLIISCF